MSRFYILLFIIAFASCDYGAIERSELQEGDILFQDLDCGAACDAIEKVTQGANGLNFSHCGIVVNVDGAMKVVEAYGSVQAVAVDEFMERSKDPHGYPKVVVGRVQEEDKELAAKSASAAKQYIGKPYDKEFKMGDGKYYCSELMYEVYKTANDDKEYFPLNKMTFKEPDSSNFMPFWVEYYQKLGTPIPEGEPGINPGAISRSGLLRIILIK